jgi:hypothetical protein
MSADVFAEDGYYAVIPEWVLDADISAQAIRLYAVLRRYADHRSREAHPSRRTLATRMHLADVKAVDRALADLKRIGAVETFERFTEDGDRASNGYRIKARGQDSSQGGGPNAIGGGGAEGRGVGVQKGEEPQPENHSQLNEGTRKRATAAPDTFELTSEMENWALDVTRELGVEHFATTELWNVTQRFLAHHQAKGSTFKRWDRAWQNWVRGDAARRRKLAPVVNGTKLPAAWS